MSVFNQKKKKNTKELALLFKLHNFMSNSPQVWNILGQQSLAVKGINEL